MGRRHEHEFVALSVSRKRVERLMREAGLQGVFWLAAVRDAFSNRIVGWRCSTPT